MHESIRITHSVDGNASRRIAAASVSRGVGMNAALSWAIAHSRAAEARRRRR